MKIFFLSLGCDKNLSDSEHMLKILADRGHSFTDDETEAECAIVNTCAFIGDAKQESIDEIIRIGALKKNAKLKLLLVTGCLAERYRNEAMELLPEIDGALGINDWDKIDRLLLEAEKKTRPAYFSDQDRLPVSRGRVPLTTGFTSYLKIAEGCSKRCSYCAIPLIRGGYRSVPMEELLSEAKSLAENGTKELILVAQETTLYGIDLYGKKSLPELVSKLSEIEKIRWIRILYCYPEELTDEMIGMIRDNEKVVKYLDIPVQHGSDAVLKRMNRATTRKEILEKIRMLRKTVPGITLRTTLMTGFPGETEEEFEESKTFLLQAKFDRLGVFAYSKEENTAASFMKPMVPIRIREKRRNELMALQQGVAFEKAKKRVGKKTLVLVEGKLADEENVYLTRTESDAPDVDGYLFLHAKTVHESGDFVKAKITGAEGYDLLGEEIG